MSRKVFNLVEWKAQRIVDEMMEFRSLRESPPKSTGVKFKLKSGKLTDKMWILPDGSIVPLRGLLHFEWLKANADEVFNRFGFKVDQDKQDTPLRLDALAKGFVRINYEYGSGTLHIEAMQKYWSSKVKDTVFMLVADNASKIDSMIVSLFASNGTVAKQAHAQLFSYRDREKLDHLPLISESSRGKALSMLKEDDLLPYHWAARRKKRRLLRKIK
jgi:hypothetical protein